MRLAKLLERDDCKIIEELTYGRGRAKVSGYMWNGSCEVEVKGITFHFEMCSHLGNEITKEQAIEKIALHGITYQDKYYDLHWYAIMTEDEVWLHPEGWFSGNKTLEAHPIVQRRKNYNFNRDTLTDEDRQELKRLGFVLVISTPVKQQRMGRSGGSRYALARR